MSRWISILFIAHVIVVEVDAHKTDDPVFHDAL
jgi:hypothetical protein